MQSKNGDDAHIEYRDYIYGFQGRKNRTTNPKDGQFEITHRCNLNCRHCYLPASWRNSGKKELEFSKICEIFDQMADSGVIGLNLTGGEIFCRRDFGEIYDYAVGKGFIMKLFTNGTLINPKIVGILKEKMPYLVEITLHSVRKETFEGITQTKNSFKACMRGIELLRDASIPLKLKTVLMNVNYPDIRRTKEYMEKTTTYTKTDHVIMPCLDGSRGPCDLRLTHEQALAFELEDERLRKNNLMLREKIANEKAAKKSEFECGGDSFGFTIDPYGMLYPCYASREYGISLREHSFSAALKLLRVTRQERNHLKTECLSCEAQAICLHCPSKVRLECLGNPCTTDYYCELTRKRYNSLIKPSQGSVCTQAA
jgi:radical SAM protein with 4Fe4S-binding SPASM domain